MTIETCFVCNESVARTDRRCPHCNTVLKTTVHIPEHLREELAKMAAELETAGGQGRPAQTSDLVMGNDMQPEFSFGKARMAGDLLLTEALTGIQYRIFQEDLQSVILGRNSLDSKETATLVDLTAVQGAERGVSRKHASIMMRDNLLVLMDHDSTNGTYVNGKRLVPGHAWVIRDEDKIQLGNVKLRVSYQKAI